MRYGAKTRPGESVKDWGLKSSGGGGGSTLSLASPSATTASPGDGYNYYIFTSSGTIDATGEGPVQVLVVGGGGGSGWTSQSSYWYPNPYGGTWNTSIGPNGGAGGGGFIEQEVKMYEGTYTVTVGAGGSGPSSSFNYSLAGEASFIAEHPSHPGGPPTWQDVVAYGGGGMLVFGPTSWTLVGGGRTVSDPQSFQPDPYAPFNPTNQPDPTNYKNDHPKVYRTSWVGGSGAGENAYGSPTGSYTPSYFMAMAARNGQGNIGANAWSQPTPSGPWGGNRGQAGGGGGAGKGGYESAAPNSPSYSPLPDYPQPAPSRAVGGVGGDGKQSPLLTNILPSIPTLSSDIIAGGGGGGSFPAPFAPGNSYGGAGSNGGGNGGPGESGWPYPPTTGQGTDGAANTGGGAGGNGSPGNSNPPPGGSRNVGNSGGSGIVVIRIAT